MQIFELDIEGNGGIYRYKLVIDHVINTPLNRIDQEEITFDGHVLFSSKAGKAQLYRDGYSKGPDVLLDWSRSGLSLLSQRADNKKLMWFKEWMSKLYCLQIDPHQMISASAGEEIHPDSTLSNFASWYRHLSQEEPNVGFNLKKSLQEVIEGFDSLLLAKEGETTRMLKVDIKDASEKPIRYDFEELSDGQRALIGLYTLLAVMKEKPITLCVDEPDNFIMLAEIEPWLAELQELADEHGSQVLLISHHPEFINYYVPRNAVRFFRQHGGPVRVTTFTTANKDVLPPAEIVARGWEDE